MPVAQLLAATDSRELSEWMAYYRWKKEQELRQGRPHPGYDPNALLGGL